MKKLVAWILCLAFCLSLSTAVLAVSPSEDTYTGDDGVVIVQELSNGDIVTTIPADTAKDGDVVEFPTEVEAAQSADEAPVISISVPKSAGKVTVEIPVSNVSYGTVAVIVNPDGTETIAKTSTVNENGIVLTIDGSTSIKIINNDVSFPDVSGWQEPGVAFAASRELFVGYDDGAFKPEEDMTKAMVVTILSRMEDAVTSTAAGNDWYVPSLEWAVGNGITDASDPGATVSRIQMVLMLYRYAGSPAVTYDLSVFTDAGDLKGEALAAMQWAVANGIVLGVGDNRLAPYGTTTRGTFATLLMRYCAVVA